MPDEIRLGSLPPGSFVSLTLSEPVPPQAPRVRDFRFWSSPVGVLLGAGLVSVVVTALQQLDPVGLDQVGTAMLLRNSPRPGTDGDGGNAGFAPYRLSDGAAISRHASRRYRRSCRALAGGIAKSSAEPSDLDRDCVRPQAT